jgi:hypothetical protein
MSCAFVVWLCVMEVGVGDDFPVVRSSREVHARWLVLGIGWGDSSYTMRFNACFVAK